MTDISSLVNFLKEELQNSGNPTSKIINILIEEFEKGDPEEFLKYLNENTEAVELLIECCDKNIALTRTLYRILYSWIQHNSELSHKLAFQFVPTLLWKYLSSLGCEEPEEAEAILAYLCNNLSLKTGFSFRLPSIHMISVYHHPAKMQYTGGLTEQSLSKGFNMEPVYTDNLPSKISTITSSNRLTILTFILQKYNQSYGDLCHASLVRYCWLCIWVCGSGMPCLAQSTTDLKCWSFSQTRFTLDKNFMTSLAAGLQYCIYNGHHIVAKKALDVIAGRAQYEVCAEVILLTSSLLDTIKISSVAPSSKPFGIPVPQLSGTQDDSRPVRRSIIRHGDIQQLRKRNSSKEIREDSENENTSPASIIVDCEDSDESSDLIIAGFRGGKLQNTPV